MSVPLILERLSRTLLLPSPLLFIRLYLSEVKGYVHLAISIVKPFIAFCDTFNGLFTLTRKYKTSKTCGATFLALAKAETNGGVAPYFGRFSIHWDTNPEGTTAIRTP